MKVTLFHEPEKSMPEPTKKLYATSLKLKAQSRKLGRSLNTIPQNQKRGRPASDTTSLCLCFLLYAFSFLPAADDQYPDQDQNCSRDLRSEDWFV